MAIIVELVKSIWSIFPVTAAAAACWLLLCSCCLGECRAVADQLEPNRKPWGLVLLSLSFGVAWMANNEARTASTFHPEQCAVSDSQPLSVRKELLFQISGGWY